MKKNSFILVLSFFVTLLFSSCGADPNAKGDAEKILGESKYKSICSEYSTVSEYNNGLCKVQKDGLYGYIDSKGELVIPCEYNDANDFCNGFAIVGMGKRSELFPGLESGEYTYISKNNEKLFELGKYQQLYDFSEGMARVGVVEKSEDEWLPGEVKYGYINTNGEEVVCCKYSGAKDFIQGLAAVEEDGKWGFIGTDGQVVISTSFYEVYSFGDGIALVNRKDDYKDDNDWVGIDKSNNVLFSLADGLVPRGGYCDGLAKVGKKDKNAECEKMYGYVDKEGKIAIQVKFEDADDFKDGIARVKNCGGSRHYFINTTGEKVEKDD